jgi:hypothetical protein
MFALAMDGATLARWRLEKLPGESFIRKSRT